MVTKESLADKAAKAARIIPGIGSYQDKEKLRDLDKRLRTYLASLLGKERSRIDERKRFLAKEGKLDRLDDLDALTRKMHQLADTITFAAYGYAPLFSQAHVDRKKLEKLYLLDQGLEKEVSKLSEKVNTVVSGLESEFSAGIRETEFSLRTIEDQVNHRNEFLRQTK
ncbi:MAG: hypothetical protein JW836_08035 [Deltaproteobacteria bacterium]|nr:hypothetical protein [Deltaproteobacteria bacterium]